MQLYDVLKSKSGKNTGHSRNCNDSFTAHACSNSFPWNCCAKYKFTRKESLNCSRRNFDELNCCACIARHTAVTTLSNRFNFRSKGLNARTSENSENGLMAIYRKVLDETETVTSASLGFRIEKP